MPGVKRNLTTLYIEYKYEALVDLENKKLTRKEICEKYNKGKSTLNGWESKKQLIMSEFEKNSKRKRIRKSKHKEPFSLQNNENSMVSQPPKNEIITEEHQMLSVDHITTEKEVRDCFKIMKRFYECQPYDCSIQLQLVRELEDLMDDREDSEISAFK